MVLHKEKKILIVTLVKDFFCDSISCFVSGYTYEGEYMQVGASMSIWLCV